jgi:hypothetical protein
MEGQVLQEGRAGTKGLVIFSGTVTAAFLILLYGSVFKGIPMGMNVPVFVAVLYASMMVSFPKRFWVVIRQSLFQTAAVVLLSIAFMLFNNLILLSINGFLIAVLVGAQYRCLLTGKAEALFSEKAVGDAGIVWLGYTFAGIRGASRTIGNTKKGKNMAGVLIGVAITIPVLAAVVALLMSADAAFSKMLEEAFQNFHFEDLPGYIIAGMIVFLMAAGLFFSLRTREVKLTVKKREAARISRITVLLPVLCLDALLAVFAVFQFTYLFAGAVPEGFTYATYAQNGFWQLVGVAVIIAAVVFFTKKTTAVQGGGVRAALAVLCALGEVVLVSAFWRMTLYEQAYSFSILRIFTQAFMVATAGAFGVLIASLVKPAFNAGKWIFIVGMSCYIALNYMNADAFIARQNTAPGKSNVDIVYLTQLSVDALPYYADRLLDAVDEIEKTPGRENERYWVSRGLAAISEGVDKAEGWQYYNVSRKEAEKYIEAYGAVFESADDYVKYY